MFEKNIDRAYMQAINSGSLTERLNALETLANLGNRFPVVRWKVSEKLEFIARTHHCYYTRTRARQIIENLNE